MRFYNKIKQYIKRNEALFIVLKYGVFGVLWILVSDGFLIMFASSFELYRLLQTYKGWIFIFITMIIVYVLVNNREKRIKVVMEDSLNTLKALKHMAYYDTLTNLPNRRMFVNNIKGLVDIESNFAIAFLDIDNFKYINDTLGHYVGDEFLKFVSSRLLQEVVSPNMVAHLGADEFAIIFNKPESKESIYKELEKIKNILGASWSARGREYFISLSAGVAIYPCDGKDFDTLLKHSDIALNAAKKDGKNKIYFYENDLHEEALHYIKMANKLQKGLENKEFELYYQSQINLDTGRLIGVEALIRWNHLGEGYISPDVFIPIAEKTGHILELERRIIENVLIQKKTWEEMGIEDLELSFNLSSKSLISNVNFKQINDIFLKYNLDYSKIVIEITETAAITNINIAIERLKILKEKGFKIALDDFGTGYSSITYLKMLPIDIVKLDKSYTTVEGKDSSIAKYIVSLAHELCLRVIAEGIETKEQLEYLKGINCESGQGYLIGRPMNIDDINQVISKNYADLELQC